jgi:hypothetical protein
LTWERGRSSEKPEKSIKEERAPMAGFYVVGGQQRHARALNERDLFWYKYHKGLILYVDPSNGEVSEVLDYVSPPDVCPDEEPAILFKSGTLVGRRLFVSTQTEVLVYSVPDFELLHYVSLPCFNDVHHVRPTPDGNLLVANSGLDMVLEMTTEGQVLREWNTLGEPPWERFSRDIDYRRIGSTKPHRSHPNQIFHVGDEVWATRFEQRDALCLHDPNKRIDIGYERVHDGLVHGDRIYFTTVDGHVIIVDVHSLAIERVLDLNELGEENVQLGWCRGVMVDDGRLWVGFSRLRMTKVRENLSWVRWGFKRQASTRVACYDLDDPRLVAEIDLQEHGLDAVFSILPGEAPSAVRTGQTTLAGQSRAR